MSNSIIANLAGGVKHRLALLARKRHPAEFSWFQRKKHKHLSDAGIKKITVNGLNISYKLRSSLFYTYPEIFVTEIYKFNTQSERPVIIDCGANIGMSTLYFAKNYPGAEIIAFEPDADNYKLLKINMDDNGISNNDIRLLQKAVWINDAGITFDAEGSESSKIVAENSSANSVYVETERLNDLLSRYSHIDFLKIDIEGAEYEVIKDCKDNLKKIKHLFLEYHGNYDEMYKLTDMLNLLTEKGFVFYIKEAGNNYPRPFYDKEPVYGYDVQLNIFCFTTSNS